MAHRSKYAAEVLHPRHEYNEYAGSRVEDTRLRTAVEKAFNNQFVKWADTVITKTSKPWGGGLVEFELPVTYKVLETPQAGRAYNYFYRGAPYTIPFIEAFDAFVQKDMIHFPADFDWYIKTYTVLYLEHWGVKKLHGHVFAKYVKDWKASYPDLADEGVVGALKFVDMIQQNPSFITECDVHTQREMQMQEDLIREEMEGMRAGGARKTVTKRKKSRTPRKKAKRLSTRRSRSARMPKRK